MMSVMMRERETGASRRCMYERVPRRLCLSLRSVLGADHPLLREVSLGFTGCGRFLISYKVVVSSGTLQYVLNFWDCHDPHDVQLFVSSRVFASAVFDYDPVLPSDNALGAVLDHNLSVTVVQPADHSCIVALGYFRQPTPEQTRLNFISIIPSTFDPTAPPCAFHFTLQSYYPHFELDQSSGVIHPIGQDGSATFRVVIDCSIAIRYFSFTIATGVEPPAPGTMWPASSVVRFFSEPKFLIDPLYTRPCSPSPKVSFIKFTAAPTGFEPEHFLGERIANHNRSGRVVLLRDYSLHLLKTAPFSSSIVAVLVANLTQGPSKKLCLFTLSLDFCTKSIEMLPQGGDQEILDRVRQQLSSNFPPALEIGSRYCSSLKDMLDQRVVRGRRAAQECVTHLCNSPVLNGRSRQYLLNPVYPFAFLAYT
ncbi:DDB1- and CUL4-associated factor 15 WD40 repeat-containing domain-containing protein [Plasmodiophora brassicae]